MKTADKSSSRRLSFTQFLSPSHHHAQIARKRAQSLIAQVDHNSSILLNGNSSPLSSSASLPVSPSTLESPCSSTSSRLHRSRPQPYLERDVQFVERGLPVHGPDHVSFSSRRSNTYTSQHVATHKWRRGKVSKTTRQLYFEDELIPIYPYRSTRFSPPPFPVGPYDDEYDSHEDAAATGCFYLTSWRRTSTDLNHELDHEHEHEHEHTHEHDELIEEEDRHCDREQGSHNRFKPRNESPADSSRPVDPLYTTFSEKLTAQWGVFMLNARFSMFRAQDRVKNGVARMGKMVRRIKTGWQSSV